MGWDFNDPEAANGIANVALYRMCRDWPLHTDVAAVSNKVQLIAKYYEVSRNLAGAYGEIAQALCDKSLGLDEQLAGFKAGSFPECASRAVALHDQVDSAVCGAILNRKPNATAKSRASFVSKYLHFHAPDAFPILDSLAETAVWRRFGRKARNEPKDRYAWFCDRIARYQAEPEFEQLSLRQMDTILLAKGRALKGT